MPLKRHEAHVAGPPSQQHDIRNDIFVPAGMTAGAHQMEHAQIFEAEGVARRHGMSLLIPAAYRMAMLHLPYQTQ
jgi:hypothetical protein